MDLETNCLIEHQFSVSILKYNHILQFLNVCAEKGQVGFVQVNIDSLNHHMYWNIVDQIKKSSVEFETIRQLVEEKIEQMIEQLTGKYYERALAVRITNL
jgi:protein-tyrosine-phosphatase